MSNLFEEISIEKDYIEKTLDVMHEAIGRPEKTYVELAAIGASLHHCYSGMENIIKRIFKARKLSVPTSSSSHKDLLGIANQHGIISDELLNRLDKFRGFRHFFIHAYGFMLNENELLPLAEELPEVWGQFENEIEDTI
ncbi:MAG: hypothetical protein HQK57_13245 [Deltaproteobacteria bacterium]|nr:hypothetical protein [Deltaproteobacteria bacterium]MBF0526925.1 hypothetical protein [Deltaproteobacteria bacterium]